MMQIGQLVLDRYEVVDLIGEGGQVCVAKGKDQDGNSVAIRQLSATPDQAHYGTAVARFNREATLGLVHPNILETIEHGEDDGGWYIILPFVDGCTLEQHVARGGGRLPASAAVALVAPIASALSACHAKSIIHRDVKPANVLVEHSAHPYLIDFGICSLAHEATLTQGSGLQGSLHWLSPEQVMNPGCQDPRLDLYALGAMLYFCLTGQIPIQGETPEEIVLSVCTWSPPPPSKLEPSVPQSLDEICMRLLEKRANDRFQTAGQMYAALSGQNNGANGPHACGSCGRPHLGNGKYCQRCGAGLNGIACSGSMCLACGEPAGAHPNCSMCGRSFGNTEHRLAFDRGALAGTTYRIPLGTYFVGRDELGKRDFQISRRHLCVLCTEQAVYMHDAGSANKTYINASLAEHPIRLEPGHRVRVASNYAVYQTQTKGN